MFGVLRRAWKYLAAMLSGRLDEMADPKIQIEQAITEAKRQHEMLSQQAASVLGNRHQLEMKIERAVDEVAKLQANARQALVLAEQARAAGDEKRAAEYESTAQTFATQLVASERSMEDLRGLYEQAQQAADAAKRAVEQNAMLLQKKLAERTKLLNQLDQAKLQEHMNEALASVSQLAAPKDVPTFDEVREKIEARYAKAKGAAELTSSSVESRMLEVERSAIDVEGAQRLEALRASMGLSKAPAPEATPVPGEPAAAGEGESGAAPATS